MFFVWQFLIASVSHSAARWLPGRAAGMVGVLLVVLGVVAFWLESAGYRGDGAAQSAKSRRRIRQSHQAPSQAGADATAFDRD
ncbi:MAG: hypothetical protein IT209_09360 [Armatimonadetes bacterium]|nr:hypothetical protein [Armatimonadota bacterium]